MCSEQESEKVIIDVRKIAAMRQAHVLGTIYAESYHWSETGHMNVTYHKIWTFCCVSQ